MTSHDHYYISWLHEYNYRLHVKLFFLFHHSSQYGVDHLIKIFRSETIFLRRSYFVPENLPVCSPLVVSFVLFAGHHSCSYASSFCETKKDQTGIGSADPWRRVDKSTDLSVRPRRPLTNDNISHKKKFKNQKKN